MATRKYNPAYSQHNELYRREKYHRVGLDLDRGYYNDVLKPAADRAGESVNTYIKNAITQRMEREK